VGDLVGLIFSVSVIVTVMFGLLVS